MHWLMVAIGALLLMLLVLMFAVVNYSTTSSTYKCQGTIAETNERQTVYIVVNQYRSWVGPWSKSNGNLYFEWTSRNVTTLFSLQKLGTILRVYVNSDSTGLKGQFSLVNKALRIGTPYGNFYGVCEGEAAEAGPFERQFGLSRFAAAS
jgi:hypothetical protein